MSKKLVKKIIMLLLVVVLSFSSSKLIFAQNVANVEEVEYSQEAALEAYNNICEGLSIDFSYENNDLPDELGGFYLDKDVLVIQLTDSSDEIKNKYLSYCYDFKDVVFEEVAYSYKYLNSLKSNISSLSRNYQLYEYYVDVYSNTLKVGVDKSDLDSITNISTYSSSPITFVESQTAMPTAMKGGEEISGGSPCSIGYFGTYGGKKALLTCGHTNKKDTIIKYNGTNIGSVTYQNLKLYPDPVTKYPCSYGDFSVVNISNSTVNTSNMVVGYGGFNATIDGTATIVAGLQIKYGGYKTTFGTGTVTSTEASIEFTDPTDYTKYVVKGLCIVTPTTNFVQGGDSGGTVYTTTAANRNCVVGIVTGNNKEKNIWYFTPNKYIESEGFTFN